ncbi:hypothetical protein [Rosistilla oblonga]|uniref:hypothetical protein n=1 Tax=Rosistilla oblonga TaxID=2527990 RepID=UPI003A977C49
MSAPERLAANRWARRRAFNTENRRLARELVEAHASEFDLTSDDGIEGLKEIVAARFKEECGFAVLPTMILTVILWAIEMYIKHWRE